MRGFVRVASLLAVPVAYTLVIPDPLPLNPIDVDDIDVAGALLSAAPRDPLNATIQFSIPCQDCFGTTDGIVHGDPIFEFSVLPANEPCGTNDLRLNGLPLFSEWEGSTAHGSNKVAAKSTDTGVLGIFMTSWQISCLRGRLEDGRDTDGFVSQILDAKIHGRDGRPMRSFALNYKQVDIPQILRQPMIGDSLYENPGEVNSNDQRADETKETLLEAEIQSCHGLRCSVRSALGKINDAVRSMCHDILSGNSASAVGKIQGVNFHPLAHGQYSFGQSSYVDHDELDETSEAPQHDELDSHLDDVLPEFPVPTLSLSIPSSLPTRSVELPALSPSSPFPSKFQRDDQTLRALKITTLVVVIVAIAASGIAFKCLMHPRRRADIAARREERRTKCLYRRAARRQSCINWLQGLRRNGSPIPTLKTKEEKRDNALEHEENTVRTELGGFQGPQIAAVDLTSTADSASLRAFEFDARGRRRYRERVDSLPGYESEGSAPPAYDDTHFIFDHDAGGLSAMGGYQYTPAATENTPDSSVIETSPRTSAETRRSDFEKI